MKRLQRDNNGYYAIMDLRTKCYRNWRGGFEKQLLKCRHKSLCIPATMIRQWSHSGGDNREVGNKFYQPGLISLLPVLLFHLFLSGTLCWCCYHYMHIKKRVLRPWTTGNIDRCHSNIGNLGIFVFIFLFTKKSLTGFHHVFVVSLYLLFHGFSLHIVFSAE